MNLSRVWWPALDSGLLTTSLPFCGSCKLLKPDLLKLPNDFEGNMRALLQTPPAPHDTAGSRKAAPKPPPKPKKKQRKRNAPRAKTGTYAYESATVSGLRAKRKAAKKR